MRQPPRRRALALSLVILTCSPAIAVAAPKEGSPLGGSSIVRGDRDFFAPVDKLEAFVPGEVIESRTLPYHVAGIPTSIEVVQLKYRSTDHNDTPTYNITSVMKPLGQPNGRLVSPTTPTRSPAISR